VIAASLAIPSIASAGQIMAGADVEDASWHVGASAGQYASDGTFAEPPHDNDPNSGSADPFQHSTRRASSYGIQSRLTARALVVQGTDGQKFAVVKTDLYIPQDLLWRRTAQILESKGTGIGRSNLTMSISHNHSSPMYSSTSWGVWAFQDVFDFRFFEYMAQTMARAVEKANGRLVPVKVGAAVTQYSFPQRNVPGPSIADDGTPAGFPSDYNEHDLVVVRFDRLSDGKTVANLVNYAVHPEDLEGNDIISAAYLGPMERMADRATGAPTIFTQASVGSTEPEDNRWHSIHERANFNHMQYAQSEFEGRGIASQIVKTYKDIANATPDDPSRFVPFRSDFSDNDVAFADRFFPGPASHPYPGVSSCRTDRALQGDPRFPVVGLPDCDSLGNEAGFDPPLQDAGVTTDTIEEFGLPVPENYSAPAYSGLEEDVSVHLQAFKIGEILFTVCSCEQWSDQGKNIKTRTDTTPGNEFHGYDWYSQCTQRPGGPNADWDCPNPGNTSQKLAPISNILYEKFRAQVRNNANGWDDLANVPFAESEPTDPNDPHFWGNYTEDDTPANAALGYPLTVAMSQANDYNGYFATYREYQRGDHYRKALTGWGPHTSDYAATRLVKMGRYLRKLGQTGAMADPFPVYPGGDNAVQDSAEWPGGGAKTLTDLSFNDQRATVIGQTAASAIQAYEAGLPDDKAASITKQPNDVERFGASLLQWVGGSNYTDSPQVRVQRFNDGKWEDYGDQSGEVPLTIKFPPATDTPSYRVTGSTFVWTATFEAFVSRFDLMDRPLATPAGVYRFRVDGLRRQGGQNVEYHLTSKEFAVNAWSGVTVDDFGQDGGLPGFKVGPRRSVDCIRDPDHPENKLTAKLGPIEYPDTYTSPVKFINPGRRCYIDPAAPKDPEKIEWYCRPQADDSPNGCSFRPWLDVGDLAKVVFTFVSASGKVDRVAGHKDGGQWVADRKLKKAEGVYIESGDACDAYGNYNGKPTAVVGETDVRANKPPAGFSCVPKLPDEDIPGGGGGSGGGGSTTTSNPLGLPSTKSCVDRRKFSFKIHQPPKQRVISVNVFINGKRRFHKHGKKVTRVTITKLPNSGTFLVRIVALTNRGNRIVSTRRYKKCKKGRPSTHVEHGK
jgi:hypothetical protein